MELIVTAIALTLIVVVFYYIHQKQSAHNNYEESESVEESDIKLPYKKTFNENLLRSKGMVNTNNPKRTTYIVEDKKLSEKFYEPTKKGTITQDTLSISHMTYVDELNNNTELGHFIGIIGNITTTNGRKRYGAFRYITENELKLVGFIRKEYEKEYCEFSKGEIILFLGNIFVYVESPHILNCNGVAIKPINNDFIKRIIDRQAEYEYKEGYMNDEAYKYYKSLEINLAIPLNKQLNEIN